MGILAARVAAALIYCTYLPATAAVSRRPDSGIAANSYFEEAEGWRWVVCAGRPPLERLCRARSWTFGSVETTRLQSLFSAHLNLRWVALHNLDSHRGLEGRGLHPPAFLQQVHTRASKRVR